jgi:hypothetical protein
LQWPRYGWAAFSWGFEDTGHFGMFCAVLGLGIAVSLARMLGRGPAHDALASPWVLALVSLPSIVGCAVIPYAAFDWGIARAMSDPSSWLPMMALGLGELQLLRAVPAAMSGGFALSLLAVASFRPRVAAEDAPPRRALVLSLAALLLVSCATLADAGVVHALLQGALREPDWGEHSRHGAWLLSLGEASVATRRLQFALATALAGWALAEVVRARRLRVTRWLWLAWLIGAELLATGLVETHAGAAQALPGCIRDSPFVPEGERAPSRPWLSRAKACLTANGVVLEDGRHVALERHLQMVASGGRAQPSGHDLRAAPLSAPPHQSGRARERWGDRRLVRPGAHGVRWRRQACSRARRPAPDPSAIDERAPARGSLGVWGVSLQ